jgi:zinc protease
MSKRFFRLYYAPNNATIAIVGDFDPAQAKTWITKYFGDLPQGKSVERPKIALAKLDANKRLVYEDRVQVPRLYIQWPTVGVKNDDDTALSVMGSILSGSRTARLTKALVYDSQIASQIFAFQNSNEDVGQFQLIVVPRPDHTLTEIEEAVDQVIRKFISEGPTCGRTATCESWFGVRLLAWVGVQSRQSRSVARRRGVPWRSRLFQHGLPENAFSYYC